MLRASCDSQNLSILLPMISSTQELDDTVQLIEQAYDEVHELDSRVRMPRIGIAVEVPLNNFAFFRWLQTRMDPNFGGHQWLNSIFIGGWPEQFPRLWCLWIHAPCGDGIETHPWYL